CGSLHQARAGAPLPRAWSAVRGPRRLRTNDACPHRWVALPGENHMHSVHRHARRALSASAVFAALTTVPAARADVTVQEQSTFDLSIIKAHGTATEFVTADKQRRDNTFPRAGFLSLLCGNSQGGEIVRLDRDLSWTLDPKKKEYSESPFPTAAQRQAAAQQVQATLDKLKQCPAAQNKTPGPDTSKCQMSPPKI